MNSLKLTRQDIPDLTRSLRDKGAASSIALKRLKNGEAIDVQSATSLAQNILKILPNVDMDSLDQFLGHPVSEIANHYNTSESVDLASIEKSIKQRQIADRAAAREQERINKAKKKAEVQALKEAEIKKQAESMSGKVAITASGVNTTSILVINQSVAKYLSKRDDIYLSGSLLSRWSKTENKFQTLVPTNLGSVLASGFVFFSEKITNQGLERELHAQCPKGIAESIIDTRYYPGVKEVDAVLSHPVVTPEGELIGSTCSYNGDYKLLFNHDLAMKNVSLEKAYADVYDVFHEFPQTAIPGALAILFTLLTRPILKTAPMLCIDAPAMSSGKSLLAQTCLGMVSGSDYSARAQQSNPAEFTKDIQSMLKDYPGKTLFLDDFSGFIDYQILKSILTNPGKYNFRILGVHKDYEASTNFAIILTGNNITLQEEINRRSIVIDVNTGVDIPAERDTTRSPQQLRKHVEDNREHLLSCVILILQDAINNATSEFKTRKMATFDEWADVVGKSVRYACHNLTRMGLLNDNIETDVTPNITEHNQMTDGTGEILSELHESLKNSKWKISQLTPSVINILDSLLGTEAAPYNTNKMRGDRLNKYKRRPYRHGDTFYRLDKVSARCWQVNEVTKQGVIIDPTIEEPAF